MFLNDIDDKLRRVVGVSFFLSVVKAKLAKVKTQKKEQPLIKMLTQTQALSPREPVDSISPDKYSRIKSSCALDFPLAGPQ